MKTISIISAAVAVLVFAGCATTFKPWNLSNVQEGMDKAQVTQILGEPDYTVNKDGAEFLYYTYREEMAPVSDASLESTEGMERRFEQFNRTLKDYKYEVVLVDGKLVNYKELDR